MRVWRRSTMGVCAPAALAGLCARPIALLAALLVSLLAATPAAAGLGTWTTSGPGGAAPVPIGHALTVDPTTPSTLYATSYGSGVFKSTDGGASWTAINTGLPSFLAMAVVVDPVTSSTVYVTIAPTTGSVGGAYKSTNGGADWVRVSNGLPSGAFGNGTEASHVYQALAIDPRNPSVLYAGSGTNPVEPALVYRTQDGAASWTLVNTGLAGATFAGAIAVHPTTSSVALVGTTTGGVFVTIDSGAHWMPLNNGLTQMFTVDLAIDPRAPGTVFLGTISGLFKSTDGGGSWSPVNGLPPGRVNAVVVDPAKSGTVYASPSCCGVYRSADGGATWTQMSGGPPAATLAISPSGICLHAAATDGVYDFAFAQDSCAPFAVPPAQTTLAAAVLPSSRAVQVGTPATAFATILNTGGDPALSVGVSLASPVAASVKYNQTSCSTNAVIAGDDVPANIPPGGQACYVVTVVPAAPFGPTEVAFAFAGTNTVGVPTLIGINTLLLLASAAPTADLVALVATPPPNDGIVRIPGVGGTGVFAAAVANVGVGDTILVSTNTGAAALPVSISLCQTDPVGGGCISAVGPTVTAFIGAGATPTFGVFVAGTGVAIPLDPVLNRVFFVLSRQSDGVTVGRTSVAVITQ